MPVARNFAEEEKVSASERRWGLPYCQNINESSIREKTDKEIILAIRFNIKKIINTDKIDWRCYKVLIEISEPIEWKGSVPNKTLFVPSEWTKVYFHGYKQLESRLDESIVSKK